jgi:hypothetical protein
MTVLAVYIRCLFDKEQDRISINSKTVVAFRIIDYNNDQGRIRVCLRQRMEMVARIKHMEMVGDGKYEVVALKFIL